MTKWDLARYFSGLNSADVDVEGNGITITDISAKVNHKNVLSGYNLAYLAMLTMWAVSVQMKMSSISFVFQEATSSSINLSTSAIFNPVKMLN